MQLAVRREPLDGRDRRSRRPGRRRSCRTSRSGRRPGRCRRRTGWCRSRCACLSAGVARGGSGRAATRGSTFPLRTLPLTVIEIWAMCMCFRGEAHSLSQKDARRSHLANRAVLMPPRYHPDRMRCDDLRLTGSGGANRVMEAELKRLVMRSPFEIRLPKPTREGEATLLYPFDARIAWVAACHHRTCVAHHMGPVLERGRAARAVVRLAAAGAARRRSAAGGGEPALLRRPRLGPRFRGLTAAAARRREERDRRSALVERRDRGSRCGHAGRRVRRSTRRHARPPPHCRRDRHRLGRAASPRRAGRGGARAAARDHGRAADHAVAVGCAHPNCWWTRWPAAARYRSRRRAWRSVRRSGGPQTCRSATWLRSPVCRRRHPTCFPGPSRAFWRSISIASASPRWSGTCAPRG